MPKPPLEDILKAAVGVATEGNPHQLHFYYPLTGGIESLPRAMAQRVRNITPGFAVRNVRRTGGGWALSDGERERVYRRLVSTVPIVEMADLFEGVPQEVKDGVSRLRYNSLFTVSIGLSTARLPEFTAIYVPDPSLIFHRLSIPAMFSPNNVPEGRALIQAEIVVQPGRWRLGIGQ